MAGGIAAMVDWDRAFRRPRWSRRDLLAAAGAATFSTPALAAGHTAGPRVSPAAALQRLMEGNARYAAGRPRRPDQSATRRMSLISSQHPFATILACADSRVGPELIFDQGLGDLFVNRVAGNVVDDVVLGSIEYSVVHLGVPLVMVLGHERCGAVVAAVEAVAGAKNNKEDADTKIGALAGLIVPAVQAVPADAPDKVDAAVLLNARRSAHLILTKSPALDERVRSGRLRVVSARYGLHDGRVTEVQTAEL
jgi:carbonic anhydrase